MVFDILISEFGKPTILKRKRGGELRLLSENRSKQTPPLGRGLRKTDRPGLHGGDRTLIFRLRGFELLLLVILERLPEESFDSGGRFGRIASFATRVFQ